jgi:hypothetical protein
MMTTNDFQGDPDPAHGPRPFIDNSNTPDDFGRSTTSRFHGRHFYADGSYTDVAKVPGGGGFSGLDQPETD